ncbi:MAG: hypothetical protein WA945_10695 [Arcobacteraceae bacterium]
MTKLLSIFFIISISCFAESGSSKYSASLDYAQVIKVNTSKSSNDSYCFDVTVRHNDTGWDHYADAWKVSDLKGNTLATRVLAHPHVSEQPFTRSKCGINIPKDLSKVIVQAKCNKHGYEGKPYILDIK